jgi:hypothetical protein
MNYLARAQFQSAIDNGAGALRRKSVCGRDPNAGPGTCYFYFDSCPAKVKNCFIRHMREWGKSHRTSDAQYDAAVAAWSQTEQVAA